MKKRIILSILILRILFFFAPACTTLKSDSNRYGILFTDEYRSGYSSGRYSGFLSGYDAGYDAGYRHGLESNENYSPNTSAERDKSQETDRINTSYLNIPILQNKLLLIILCVAGIVLIALILALHKSRRKIKHLQTEIKRLRSEILASPLKNDTAHYSPQPALETQRKEESVYPAVIPSLQAPREPSPIRTFGNWPSTVHDSEKQFQKFMRASMEPIEILERDGDRAHILGGSGNVYATSLNDCNCPDFNINEHQKAPCKHIYFLAIQTGIPVAELFEDYIKP